MKFDLSYIRENAKSIIRPVIISNMEVVKSIEKTQKEYVDIGDLLFTVFLK